MRMIKERYRRSPQDRVAVRLRPVFDDFHLLRMEGDYEYPRHQHTNHEIVLVDRGPYRCELNGVELTLVDGQALIVQPGDWHADHLCDGQRHHVIHCRLRPAETGGAVPRIFVEGVAPEGQVCRVNLGQDAWLVAELRREAEQPEIYGGAVQDSLLEALFWRILRGLPVQSLSAVMRRLPQQEHWRERLFTVIYRHLQANLTVGEMAAALRMSPRHLTNLCREICGESPARVFLRVKLERADEMLRFRGLRVSEVSQELGFANPYHFSRVYQRHFGHSPSRQRTVGQTKRTSRSLETETQSAHVDFEANRPINAR